MSRFCSRHQSFSETAAIPAWATEPVMAALIEYNQYLVHICSIPSKMPSLHQFTVFKAPFKSWITHVLVKNLKLSRLWCFRNVYLLWVFSIQFPDLFFFMCRNRTVCRRFSAHQTASSPIHLRSSSSLRHHHCLEVEKGVCRAATPLSVTGTAKPNGIAGGADDCCERDHSVGRHARRWWERLMGYQRPTDIARSSFLPVFCRSLHRHVKSFPFCIFGKVRQMMFLYSKFISLPSHRFIHK